MPIRQLSNGDTDGSVFGQSATDLVSFHGATPTARGAAIANATDAATAISQLNLALAFLRTKGLIAS